MCAIISHSMVLLRKFSQDWDLVDVFEVSLGPSGQSKQGE